MDPSSVTGQACRCRPVVQVYCENHTESCRERKCWGGWAGHLPTLPAGSVVHYLGNEARRLKYPLKKFFLVQEAGTTVQRETQWVPVKLESAKCWWLSKTKCTALPQTRILPAPEMASAAETMRSDKSYKNTFKILDFYSILHFQNNMKYTLASFYLVNCVQSNIPLPRVIFKKVKLLEWSYF